MPPQWHKQFQTTTRGMVRFMLAKKLGLERNCANQSANTFECKVENDTFSVEVQSDKIVVTKNLKIFPSAIPDQTLQNLSLIELPFCRLL